MRVASGELRPLTAPSRRKKGSHEFDGALCSSKPRPNPMTDGSSQGSIAFHAQKRRPEGDKVKNQFQCLTQESPCEQSRGRRMTVWACMLWPLDCFVARAPRNDGWGVDDPILD